MNAEVCTFEEK
jgi:hypothetical protein